MQALLTYLSSDNMDVLFLDKRAASPVFRGGRVALYVKSDGLIYFKDAYGAEQQLSSSAIIIPPGGTSGQVLKKSSNADYAFVWGNDLTEGEGSSVAWGAITGTLSNQSDLVTALNGKAASSHFHPISDVTGLQTALDGKAASSHNHSAANITSGTIATARLGSGTANSSTFLRGDQTYAVPPGDPFTRVNKTADTSKASDVSLAADPTLQFEMAANTPYSIELEAIITSYNVGGTGPNFDFRITGPASPTLVALQVTPMTGGLAPVPFFLDAYSTVDHTVTFPTGAGPRTGRVFVKGVIINGANAGTFSINWAQTASSANATIMKDGSNLSYRAL